MSEDTTCRRARGGSVGALRHLRMPAVLVGAMAAMLSLAGPAAPADLLQAEQAVFGAGASATWRGTQIGGTGIGGVRRAPGEEGSGNLGRQVKAGLLSLLLPGAGQYYNGDAQKAYIFAGAEAAVWATYLTFHLQGNSRTDTYQEYAGIYAGTQGEHADAYWRAVGRYMDSDAYNEAVLREARAYGQQPGGLVSPEAAWQWRNTDHLRAYQQLRADANRSYDRRNFMTLFAVVNRVAAVYDAVRSSVDDKMNLNVLGLRIEMDVSPSLHNPRGTCVVSRRF